MPMSGGHAGPAVAMAAVQTPAARPAGNHAAFAVLVLLVLALQFGPAVGLLGYRWTDDSNWALSGVLRDAAVALLVLLALRFALPGQRSGPLPASARWALLVVVAAAALALLSGSGLIPLALNLRRIALVPLLYLAVLLTPWTTAQRDRLLALVVSTSLLVALLGLAERLSPDRLWTEVLDIVRFTSANGLDRFGKQDFYDSGRYFSWDLARWTDAPVRRMLSTYLEPTTLAAGMSVLLVMALARQARGFAGPGLCLLATVCGLLTLSKGFVMFLLALLAWRWLGLPSPRQVVAITLAAVAAALALSSLGLVDGPFAHLAGVDNALRYLLRGQLLGEGIGEAGNYTNGDTELGAESGLGNAIAQAGLAAFLPVFWLRAIGRETLQLAAATADPGGPWLAMWTLFWVLSYVFSASSQGVGGNALGFLVLALYLHPLAHRSTP